MWDEVRYMWNEIEMKEYIKKNLKKERYEHSLGVMDTAVELAKRYSADEEKAKIAGLIHDCAKSMKNDETINLVKKHNYHMDDTYMQFPQLMHGLAGAIVAKAIMGVRDEDILNAITFHTTGREAMSTLDKIIYIADYIEPSRNFNGVEELRRAAFENLNKGLLLCFNSSIKFIIEKGEILHTDTIKARNYIISEEKYE